jgi:hypothetical protein
MHDVPGPIWFAGHAQVKPPAVFVHVAAVSQLSVPAVHSLMSTQVVPLNVYPALHAHV